MATNKNVRIGVQLDVEKTGLSSIQNELSRIMAIAQKTSPGKVMSEDLQKASKTAEWLFDTLEKCFNADIGTINVSKFNQELIKSNQSLQSVKNNLTAQGVEGARAFNLLSKEILGTNIQLKESNALVDKLAKSMTNTVTWGITSGIFNTITSSLSKSVHYAERLNGSLNDIRIVTGASSREMEKFAKSANDAARNLGSNTLDYTNAALIYYQQGLAEADVKARTEATIKAANVTGQTGETVSEQLTAVWNGYKVNAAEAELYVDKLAAVAAKTGADLEELSVGMGKVASAANTMGVDVDQLNAQLSTIITVTRQAPEAVGTALKTIYARLGNLEIGETDEDGLGLGEVAQDLEHMGIKILDEKENLRDFGEIIEEVGGKWNQWTEAEKMAIATAMAGTRQFNNLLALFENWDMYETSIQASISAIGTLQEQQDIYMESTEYKLNRLEATWQKLYDTVLDDDTIHFFIEGLTGVVSGVETLLDTFGGGIPGLVNFGSMFASVFDKQITKAIVHATTNMKIYQNNLDMIKMKQAAIDLSVATLDKKEKKNDTLKVIEEPQIQIPFQKKRDFEKQAYKEFQEKAQTGVKKTPQQLAYDQRQYVAKRTLELTNEYKEQQKAKEQTGISVPRFNDNVPYIQKATQNKKLTNIENEMLSEAAGLKAQEDYAKRILAVQGAIDNEQYSYLLNLQKTAGELEEQLTYHQNILTMLKEEDELANAKDDTGNFSFGKLTEIQNTTTSALTLQQDSISNLESAKTDFSTFNSDVEDKGKADYLAKLEELKSLQATDDIGETSNVFGDEAKASIDAWIVKIKEAKDVTTEIAATQKEVEKLIDKTIGTKKEEVEQSKKTLKLTEKALKSTKQINELIAKRKSNALEFEYAEQTAKSAADIQKKVQFITGAMSTLSSSINMGTSLVKIWGDESITAWEKVTALATSLGTTIPTLIKGIDTLAKSQGLSTLGEALGSLNTKNREVKEGAEQLVKAFADSEKKIDLETAKTIMNTVAKDKNNNKTLESQLLAKGYSDEAIKAALATDAGTAANTKATVAQQAFNTAAWANPYLIVGAVVLAGIAGVIAGIAANAEKAAKSQEEWNKTFEESSNNFTQLQTEVENLNTALGSLNDKIKELNDIVAEDRTLVQNEELAKLDAEKALLEGQIIAKQKLMELETGSIVQQIATARETEKQQTSYIGTIEDPNRRDAGKYSSAEEDLLDTENNQHRVNISALKFERDTIKTGDWEDIAYLYSEMQKQLDIYTANPSDVNDQNRKAVQNEFNKAIKKFGSIEEVWQSYAAQVEQYKTALPSLQGENKEYAQSFIQNYYKTTGQWNTLATSAIERAVTQSDITQDEWGKIQEKQGNLTEQELQNLLGEKYTAFKSSLDIAANTYGVSVDSIISILNDGNIIGQQFFETLNTGADTFTKKQQKITKTIEEFEFFSRLIEQEIAQFNSSLAKLEHTLNSVAKAKERVNNVQLISLLNEEKKLNQETITLLNQKIYNYKKEARLKANILNVSYDSKLVKSDGSLNENAIDMQEASFLSELANAKNKTELEEIQKRYDEFLTAINDYRQLQDETFPALKNEIEDELYRQIDLNLETITVELEAKLNTTEFQREWLDFKKDTVDPILTGLKEDDFAQQINFNTAKLNTYLGTNGDIQSKIDAINKITNSSYSATDTTSRISVEASGQKEKDRIAQIKELISSVSDVKILADEVEKSFTSAFDNIGEVIEEQFNVYDKIAQSIQHELRLNQLIYGEESYDKLENVYMADIANVTNRVQLAKAQMETYSQIIADTSITNETIKENAKKQYAEAAAIWQTEMEDAIEAVQAKYENTINKMFKEAFNFSLTELGPTWEDAYKDWGMISTDDEKYLDATNAAYEKQLIANKYNKAYEKASLSVQQKITEAMREQEIIYQQRDKLTKTDIERANLKYDLTMKQIALEEARENATTLRLRRDASGNMSYTFVADDDAISKAQEEVDAVNNAIYNLDKDAYKANLDEFYNMYTQYQEELKAAALLGEDERDKAIAKIQERYGDRLKTLLGENSTLWTTLDVWEGENPFGPATEGIQAFMAALGDGTSENNLEATMSRLTGDGEGSIQKAAEAMKSSLSSIFGTPTGGTDIFTYIANQNTAAANAISAISKNTSSVMTEVSTTWTETQKYFDEFNKIWTEFTKKDGPFDKAVEIIKTGVEGLDNINTSLNTETEQAIQEAATAFVNAILIKLGIQSTNTNEETDETPPPATGMASGGYTGSWGDTGKLAVLHEKELVLNQTDTSNVLAAVSIIRDVASLVGNLQTSVNNRISAATPAAIPTTTTSSIVNNNPVDQKIQIEAHFPNATSASEIETAFTDLFNIASQRAYENKI